MINTEVEWLTNQLRKIRLEQANIIELLKKITKAEVNAAKELEGEDKSVLAENVSVRYRQYSLHHEPLM